MLKLPTMSMDIFKKVLGNVDENYPFSMSPKLILALLVFTGVCTIVIGILFIWYKRKTSFTSSTMGNLLKLIPSLKEKIPTLDSLLPILSEQAPSQNTKNILTNVAVPQLLQTPPDKLVLPPVLVPKLQLEKPLTTVPYHTTHMEPLPSTSTDYKSKPLSSEMFNCAATNLNEKGVILRSIKNICTSCLTKDGSSIYDRPIGPHKQVCNGRPKYGLCSRIKQRQKTPPKTTFH